MKARMQELLGLLSVVVERIRTANERTAQAESRAEAMAGLLDALSEENTDLRAELQQAEDARDEALHAIARLNAQLEEGARLTDVIEARAADAELRIHRAAEALGLPFSPHTLLTDDETANPSAALH